MTRPPIVPGSRASKILAVLAQYPETTFRAFNLAAELDEQVQPVANEAARLARKGMLVRSYIERPGGGAPITVYSHKP